MADAQIRVTIPAESRFVALARVTTASLAAELGFSIDEIEELRVGADELIALLVEWAEDHDASEIAIEFRLLDDDRIEVIGDVVSDRTGTGGEAVLDVLTEEILTAVVDEFDIGSGHGRITKRRTLE